jgi:hypothetical protein
MNRQPAVIVDMDIGIPVAMVLDWGEVEEVAPQSD